MNKSVKYIIWGVSVFLAQILISEYVNIWPMLYIAIYPLILIIIPQNINTVVYMIIAFALGLGIDSLADGIPGLNAAACVAMAYSRKTALNLILKKSALENISRINSREIRIKKFIFLCIFMYSVFFLVYISLDNLWSEPSFFIFIRLAVNITVNVILAFIIESTLISRFIIKERG